VRETATFADDERARVPFALIGVLLLVSSATFVVAVQPERPPAEPAVDVVMGGATSETRTAIRQAVRTASANAARNPVVDRTVDGEDAAGSVLNESTPFRDSLRIRVYLQARNHLANTTVRRDGVTASVSLPPTPNESALRNAKRRISLEPANENATTIRVRIENVTIRAVRGNRTVGVRTISPVVTVRTPVLALHERVSAFQERLDRGIGRPGLTQGVTMRLYPLTWARGAAFRAGAPIENVVGTRHVEFVTNHALLAEQRAVFGRSDAAGRRAQRRAATRVALTDAFRPLPDSGAWLPFLLEGEPPGPTVPSVLESATGGRVNPSPDDEVTIGVNETADYAFANLVDRENLTAVFEDVYSADVRLVTRQREVDWNGQPDWPAAPSVGDWRLVEQSTERSYAVENGSDPRVVAPEGTHLLTAGARRVSETVTHVREWERENETRSTSASVTNEYRVDVGLAGAHADTEYAPRRGIESVHERGGPFDGPNLASIAERARVRLVENRGGFDGIARRVVQRESRVNTTTVTVQGDLPNGSSLRSWVIRDLDGLREQMRNVSTTAERGRLASFEAYPAGDLENHVLDRRDQFLDAPDTYESVAHKARVAARGAYVEAVRERLLAQRSGRRDREDNLGDVFDSVGAGSVDLLQSGLDVVEGSDRPGVTNATEASGVRITSIDGSPPYLTTSEVGSDYAPSLRGTEEMHPLATRNVNVFTNPYGDVVDTLLGGLLGDSVPLRTAASTLHGSEPLAERGNQTITEQRDELETDVAESVDYLRGGTRLVLASYDVGDNQSERAAIVDEGLEPWETTAGEALAFTNGSAAESIATVAAERVTHNESARAVVATDLQLAIRTRLDDSRARVSEDVVNRSHELVRSELRRETRNVAENVTERAITEGANRVMDRLNRSFNRVQTGLPVMPTGNWFATINFWFVEARGGYDRFAVRARRGSPNQPGSSVRYVRDGRTVRIDYDDDGTAERFGESERVTFTTRTMVPMAVPPGMPGVGDTNGDMDERSDSWAEWTGRDVETVPWEN